MNKLARELYTTLHQFGRLRMGDLFPEVSKGDCVALQAIDYYAREKGGNLTVSELADKLRVQSSAVSRSLKALENKGYVERTIHKSDRRNTYVALTELGKEELKSVQATINEFSEAIISRMNETDIQEMIVALNNLYEITQEAIEACSKKRKEE